jgi:hypothetical protein
MRRRFDRFFDACGTRMPVHAFIAHTPTCHFVSFNYPGHPGERNRASDLRNARNLYGDISLSRSLLFGERIEEWSLPFQPAANHNSQTQIHKINEQAWQVAK